MFTQDWRGVLYEIMRTLAQFSLDIAFARVSTQAHRVADSFYVTDLRRGGKVTDAARIEEVRRALRDRLVRGAPGGEARP